MVEYLVMALPVLPVLDVLVGEHDNTGDERGQQKGHDNQPD